MSIFNELNGILFAKNITIPDDHKDAVGGYIINRVDGESGIDTLWCIDKRIHKFPYDEVLKQNETGIYFLDGYVENKDDICKEYNESRWEDALIGVLKKNKVSSLRGGFCGFCNEDGKCMLFADHVGNRALYYYSKGNVCIFSTRLFYITEVMKKSGIMCTIDEQAIRYLLTLGFMPDDSTVCREVKRVLPGNIVEIMPDGNVEIKRYFKPDNTKIQTDMSFDDAVEGVDLYFRQAIKREFEKDIEYGYRHLVDLSGGLDSRMTSWVAHEMGYNEQINITYCQKDYLDFKIAQRIACDLRHKFIFMPLDDFKWMEDIEQNVLLLNGSAPYSGSTGAHHILSILKACGCGIEHTGMVGDAIIGTFYKDKEYNYSKPVGNENVYSSFLKCDIPVEVLEKFDNREQFSIYTRGLLGAQSSYMLRQNYFETASPFLDADFLGFILSVPFEYRADHKLYLAWIKTKHSGASQYGWEKWHGVRPTEEARKFRKKMSELKYKANRSISKLSRDRLPVGMTPTDYWYRKYPETAALLSDRFRKSIEVLDGCVERDLLRDMKEMYNKGKTIEKALVITACEAMMRMMEESCNV